jgi:GNAT superfamily N-acetyltransferase
VTGANGYACERQIVVRPSKDEYQYHELTMDRWSDLETLFGARGACGGCWCMWWRLKRSIFNEQKGDKNKASFKAVVDSGDAPGILAYHSGNPIGWCALAPRETYPALERSRVLKRIDEKPVWSIVCLFIARSHRRKGLSVELLKAAAEYVRKRGGKIVEGYPVEPRQDNLPDAFAWTGLASAFLKAGFVECERRSETRPIMRRVVRPIGYRTEA